MRPAPLLLLVALCGACSRGSSEPSPPGAAPSASVPDEARWLVAGPSDERFVKVARHLRGFDMAMVETGHRYGELHWAGKDRNWEYAAYQLGKIETAVANGAERRPRRAASSRMLAGAVEQVRAAIGRRDADAFDAAFGALTTTCNECHKAERVAFIHVEPPSVRASIVHPGPAASR